MLENTDFAFIVNLLDVKCNMPFEIIEGCYLQKATKEQIDYIKSYLAKIGYLSLNIYHVFLYEYDSVFIKEGIEVDLTSHNRIAPLDSNEWRYYVLAFNCPNSNIYDLGKAAYLLSTNLEFGIQFWKIPLLGGGYSYGAGGALIFIFNYLQSVMQRSSFTLQGEVIEETHLVELRHLYQQIQDLDEVRYSRIKTAIEMVNNSKMLSNYTDFKLLNYYTIIEFLIMQNPKNKNNSLTKQFKTKLPKLSEEFPHIFDYSNFDKDTPKDEIWRKLYVYRSCIAHGSVPDFSEKLKELKNKDAIQIFLESGVKKMLTHALSNPQRYIDLKEN